MVVAPAQPEASTRHSIDDLDQFPDDGKRRELVHGRVVEWEVTTGYHGWMLAALTHLLRSHVMERRLGLVEAADSLIMIQGSRYDARGPDVAFFARGRIPRDLKAPASATAPDFVIEILSPSDRAVDVQEKVLDWLRAGVRLLWFVNPETGTTTVYYGGRVHGVGAEEVLDGADVAPGFSVRLRDLYDELEALQGEGE